MSIHLVPSYWPAVLALAIGLLVGEALGVWRSRSGLAAIDRRATVPLLLAAALAHLSLIPAVELERQVLFGLYFLALVGVIGFALRGIPIWRLGAVVFPLGSIGAYLYFALSVHQADYIGLLVKLVEVAAVLAAAGSFATRRRATALRSAGA